MVQSSVYLAGVVVGPAHDTDRWRLSSLRVGNRDLSVGAPAALPATVEALEYLPAGIYTGNAPVVLPVPPGVSVSMRVEPAAEPTDEAHRIELGVLVYGYEPLTSASWVGSDPRAAPAWCRAYLERYDDILERA